MKMQNYEVNVGVISSIHSVGQSMIFSCTNHTHNQSMNMCVPTVGSGTELLQLTSRHVARRFFGQQLLLHGVHFQLPLHVDPGALFGTREVLSQSASSQRSTTAPVRQPGGFRLSAFALLI